MPRHKPKFREAEETRNTRRTVPAATFLALGVIAVVYAGVSWAMAVHAGTGHVIAAARQQGPGLMFGLGGGPLPQAGAGKGPAAVRPPANG